jgi:hypothetical protein
MKKTPKNKSAEVTAVGDRGAGFGIGDWTDISRAQKSEARDLARSR